MPLPFTGLQAFHWGDGVKVRFLYAVLVVVVVMVMMLSMEDSHDGELVMVTVKLTMLIGDTY